MNSVNPRGLSERMTPVENSTIAEMSGQEYAQSLLATADPYTEERSMGGSTPLAGFAPTPKLAGEPYHAFVQHKGRWTVGKGLGWLGIAIYCVKTSHQSAADKTQLYVKIQNNHLCPLRIV